MHEWSGQGLASYLHLWLLPLTAAPTSGRRPWSPTTSPYSQARILHVQGSLLMSTEWQKGTTAAVEDEVGLSKSSMACQQYAGTRQHASSQVQSHV